MMKNFIKLYFKNLFFNKKNLCKIKRQNILIKKKYCLWNYKKKQLKENN